MQQTNKGKFQKGFDARRHVFTQEECQAGFQAAIDSLVTRYPNTLDSAGRHMACNFGKYLTRKGRMKPPVSLSS